MNEPLEPDDLPDPAHDDIPGDPTSHLLPPHSDERDPDEPGPDQPHTDEPHTVEPATEPVPDDPTRQMLPVDDDPDASRSGPGDPAPAADYWRPGVRLDARVVPASDTPPQPPPSRTGWIVAAILVGAVALTLLVLAAARWLDDDTVTNTGTIVVALAQAATP